jgi:hypothetical protein
VTLNRKVLEENREKSRWKDLLKRETLGLSWKRKTINQAEGVGKDEVKPGQFLFFSRWKK